MNRENNLLCIVFAMGMEAGSLLERIEVKRRWKRGKATYREARFQRRPLLMVRSGIGPKRAASAIRGLECTPSAIVSAGTAGALTTGMNRRDVVVAGETVASHETGRVLTHPTHFVDKVVNACQRHHPSVRTIRLATANAPVWAREDREHLHASSGAHAVDMESHAIGLEAERMGVPFVSVRVISDDFDAPPLTDPKELRRVWRTPWRLPRYLFDLVRWLRFVREFRQIARILGPVLTSIIVDLTNDPPCTGNVSRYCDEPSDIGSSTAGKALLED